MDLFDVHPLTTFPNAVLNPFRPGQILLKPVVCDSLGV